MLRRALTREKSSPRRIFRDVRRLDGRDSQPGSMAEQGQTRKGRPAPSRRQPPDESDDFPPATSTEASSHRRVPLRTITSQVSDGQPDRCQEIGTYFGSEWSCKFAAFRGNEDKPGHAAPPMTRSYPFCGVGVAIPPRTAAGLWKISGPKWRSLRRVNRSLLTLLTKTIKCRVRGTGSVPQAAEAGPACSRSSRWDAHWATPGRRPPQRKPARGPRGGDSTARG